MEEIEQGPSPVEVEVKYTLGDFKKCVNCGFLKHKTEEYQLQGDGTDRGNNSVIVLSNKIRHKHIAMLTIRIGEIIRKWEAD